MNCIYVDLMTTSGCHLCEQAERLIRRVATDLNLKIALVDIALDDELFNRYGVHIPVLYHADSHSELRWPFDEEGLVNWAQSVTESTSR